MKKALRKTAGILMILIAVLLAFSCAAAEDAGTQYMENIWNFVDGSMDVSQGIPQDAEGVLGLIRDRGVLRVATEPYFPPQEFIDPALEGQRQYVGADMEFARLLAERMGVELEIIPMEFTEVLNAVAEGVCDLAISGLAYTPARASAVEMSKGYHFSQGGTGCVLLIRIDDAEDIMGIGDLATRKIVAQSGSLQEALSAQNITVYREFQRLSSIQEVYTAVETGDADAAVVNMETAQAYIRNNRGSGLSLVTGVRFQQKDVLDGDRVAGKKGEFQLMYFVNGVIDELTASGRYEQWFDEYSAYAALLGM